MARFVFVCIPTSGHLAPLAAVARELVAREHEVTFLHHPDVASLVRPFGVDFEPIAAVGATAEGLLEAAVRRVGQVRGLRGLRGFARDMADSTTLLCERLPDALRELKVDCIVGDWLEPAAGLVAHRLGLPYVSIAAALPMNWSPGDASPFVGWTYRPGPSRRWGSMGAQWIAERVQGPSRAVIARYADRWRLGRGTRVEDWASGFAQIGQLPRSLDFPRRALIGCFHYCGPLRQAPAATTLRPARNGRRRIFASLGSLQGHRANVFEWITDAAQALDLDLTIAHGGRLSEADAARLSRRAEVHAAVDYASALRDCDVAIMHGGLNGVLDALTAGVPLVVVPIAFEQGAIAARVRHVGAGRVCRPLAGGGRLAAAITDVLDDPAYARAAARIGADIATAGGATRAADIVEQVARTRAPCLSTATMTAALEPRQGYIPRRGNHRALETSW